MSAPEWVSRLSELQDEYTIVNGVTFHSSFADFLFVKLSGVQCITRDFAEALAKLPCETKGVEDSEPGCCAPCRARRYMKL